MDILSAWLSLTFPGRFYIFCLLSAVAYATAFHLRTLFRLHELQREGGSAVTLAEKLSLASMSRGLENMRQLHLLLLLSLGMALANELFATLRGIRYASMSLSGATVEILEPCVTFAFFVFAVLTFLHVFHWLVVSRFRRRSPLCWD